MCASSKAAEQELVVLDEFKLGEPKTSEVVKVMKALGVKRYSGSSRSG
jgi:ribosomal protein L4